MKLRNRLLIVLAGIIIFLIVTPILVLFARGFKFDFKTGLITKTATMVVQTQPEKATVFLNDVRQKDHTPSTLRFLTPGDYVVKIEKDGYQSWVKRLAVRSQLVTWANNNREYVALFLKEPKILDRTNFQNYILATDYKQLIFKQDNQLSFLDLHNKEISVLGLNDLTIHPFDYTNTLAWTDAKRSYDLLTSKKNLNFDENLLSKIQKVATNGSHIILLIENNLYEFSDKLNLIETQAVSPTLDGNNAWYIIGNKLVRYDLESRTKTVVTEKVPTFQTSEIIRANGHVFLLLDKALYMVNDQMDKIYGSVNFVNWDQKTEKLLFANDFEVFIFSPYDKRSELVLRSTSKITTPFLNGETGFVFYENEAKIKAIEIDGRDNRNIYNLADAEVGFLISADGKMLYTFDQVTLNSYQIR